MIAILIMKGFLLLTAVFLSVALILKVQAESQSTSINVSTEVVDKCTVTGGDGVDVECQGNRLVDPEVTSNVETKNFLEAGEYDSFTEENHPQLNIENGYNKQWCEYLRAAVSQAREEGKTASDPLKFNIEL